MSDAHEALGAIEVPGVAPLHVGKVRAVYDAGPERLLIVASDRVSAYDVVLPTPIPDKGRVLTQLSAFWFARLRSAAPHHVLSTDRADFPPPFAGLPWLDGRAMLCRRARRVDVECVVRGHLTGSGLREYRRSGTLNGEPLPAGLADGSPLDPPRFTPTTKEEQGHDQPMTRSQVRDAVGDRTADELEERSLALYAEAAAVARAAGLVLADTKFEFGWVEGRLAVIDELLSPDASRFWDAAAYARGRLESFDKQYVRDWLDRSGWNHEPPAPALPPEVVAATRARYLQAAVQLMGPAEAARRGLRAAARP